MEDKQVFFHQPDGQTDTVNTIDLFCVRCRKLNLGPSVSPFQCAHQYHRQCHDYRRSQHGRHVTCVICHLPLPLSHLEKATLIMVVYVLSEIAVTALRRSLYLDSGMPLSSLYRIVLARVFFLSCTVLFRVIRRVRPFVVQLLAVPLIQQRVVPFINPMLPLIRNVHGFISTNATHIIFAFFAILCGDVKNIPRPISSTTLYPYLLRWNIGGGYLEILLSLIFAFILGVWVETWAPDPRFVRRFLPF